MKPARIVTAGALVSVLLLSGCTNQPNADAPAKPGKQTIQKLHPEKEDAEAKDTEQTREQDRETQSSETKGKTKEKPDTREALRQARDERTQLIDQWVKEYKAKPTATVSRWQASTPIPTPPLPADLQRPQLPAQAREKTPEGAQAAAGYFLEVFHYVNLTQDATVLDTICHPKSDWCDTFREITEENKTDGNWTRYHELISSEITEVDTDYFESENVITIFQTVTNTGSIFYDADTKQFQDTRPRSFEQMLELRYLDDQWKFVKAWNE